MIFYSLLFVVLSLLCLMGLIFSSSLAVDIFVRFLSRINRKQLLSHKWDSQEQWMQKVTEASAKMVQGRPTVRVFDGQWGILYALFRHQYSNAVVSRWQYAPLIASVGNDDDCLNNIKIKEIDDGFGLYCGWRFKSVSTDVIKNLAESFLNLVKSRTSDEGLICYRHGDMRNMFFVDSIPFMCPCLIRYGLVFNNRDVIDLALQQIKFYYKVGYLSSGGLYAHACDMKKGKSYGFFGWGRGTGWWCLGILFSYLECPEGADKAWLKQLLNETVVNIIQCQREDGGWGTNLVLTYPYDSTATAIFVYFLMQVDKINQTQIDTDIIQRGIEKLMSATREDGRIDLCEADCHGLGKYSKLYTISPFGQGIVQMIVNELSTHKI